MWLYKSIPNLLSLLRLFISFAFPFLILDNKIGLSIILFLIAGTSDFFDGYLARKFMLVSSFGKKIDPLADKSLMLFSYLSLCFMGFIPFYVALVVVLRDVLILSVVIICIFMKIVIKFEPLFSSKINTAIQITYILIVLFCKYYGININSIMEPLSYVVCLFTIFSACEYVKLLLDRKCIIKN